MSGPQIDRPSNPDKSVVQSIQHVRRLALYFALTILVGGAGNGLTNMPQRLTELGGQCRVASEPGAGSRVKFEVFASNKSVATDAARKDAFSLPNSKNKPLPDWERR